MVVGVGAAGAAIAGVLAALTLDHGAVEDAADDADDGVFAANFGLDAPGDRR
jgi:hypothetical protein